MKIRVPYDRLGRYYYFVSDHISFEDLYNYNFNQYAAVEVMRKIDLINKIITIEDKDICDMLIGIYNRDTKYKIKKA